MRRRAGRPFLLALLVAALAGCERQGASGTASDRGEVAVPPALGLCVSCHGEDGRAVVRGYPHLDGQDERYLFEQLLAYRSGMRKHAPMQGIVGALDDEALAALAAWYASRERPSLATAGEGACPPAPGDDG